MAKRRKHLGAVKHDAAKARRAGHGRLEKSRALTVTVKVGRTGGYRRDTAPGAARGEFYAMACLRNMNHSTPMKSCRNAEGTSPTQAVGRALKLLGSRVEKKR